MVSSSLFFHVPGKPASTIVMAFDKVWLANMRPLWQILLGDAQVCPQGGEDADSARPSLQSDARGAIARLRLFSQFIGCHPLLGRIPELPVFLDGALMFLEERAAPYAGQALQLIAQQHGAPGDADDIAVRCQEQWRVLASIMEQGKHHFLESFLRFDRRRGDMTCGPEWVSRDGFGLHSLSHPYFSELPRQYFGGLEHAPRAPGYASWRTLQPIAGSLAFDIEVASSVASPPPAEFTERSAYDGTMGGYFVREGELWGFYDRNRLVQPCAFDKFESPCRDDDVLHRYGYRVWQQGLAGWVRTDGKLLARCEWEDVLPTYAKSLLTVKRNGRWGLVDRRRRQIVPCEYRAALVPIGYASMALPMDAAHGSHPAGTWFGDLDFSSLLMSVPSGRPTLYIRAEGERGAGVIDDTSRVIVPLAYAQVEPLRESHHPFVDLFELVSAQGLHGMWSVTLQREVLPCEHEWVAFISAAGLCVSGAGQRFRLFDRDGSQVPHEFLWFSADLTDFNEPGPGYEARFDRERINAALADGKPVRAVAWSPDHADGLPMLIVAGQPPQPEHAYLEHRWLTRGDRLAAHILALRASERLHAPGDPVAARLWSARACGHDPAPATATDVLDETAPGAVDHFVDVLDRGIGGPRDAALARYWAGQAAQASGDVWHLRRYIRLLLDAQAGPIDPVRALELIRALPAGPWYSDEVATLHARCLIEGLGSAPNWPAARELLYRSHRLNDREGAAMMAQLLRIMARDVPAEAQHAMLAEAKYFQARADDWPSYPGRR